ncbi:MAG: D-alanyl-D-alanine carboxypeptidase/D-alanyl-D-alanine-endopeptidase [Deltaproteobacteria bacterium]|nr:MAG: D-alanyl-D-alanine carboxypeptidase/D-alanyl-D-alanine-endopeptidase [Deltaproteobacteria bacterium]
MEVHRRRSPLPFLAACAACFALATSARATPADREALRKAVDQLLAQPPLLGAHISIEVDSLEDGQPVYSRSADEQLNPASNTKLITSAAALLRLGPEYRFATDYLTDRPLQRGRTGVLYVRGRGDPSVSTERLDGLVSDLWHRGLREVRDIVLDDSFFDREEFGPGWEQETSDKAWAAGVGALSLNHNSVSIYMAPGNRAGARARIDVEPDTRDYFTVWNEVVTVRQNGRRKLRPHTLPDGEKTRIEVEGRIPLRADPVMLYRRVGDPTFYYGQTLRMLFKRRGIRVTGRVKRGVAPENALLLQSYDSPELAEIVRDMNKASSNFIAEMLVKTLGAELKGTPGTWPKGLQVAEDLLAEMGLSRGSYTLKNGSGLNDTNRFSARQIATLLSAVWKRFPIAAEFMASLGIAARDGTMRLRMEGTDAAGRLRAKTGTLERVTALSGYVQSLGGERFVFSALVNDWSGRTGPVNAAIDRLGAMLAASGAPEAGAREAALASLAPQELQPAELKARIATYAALAVAADKKNLPFLRSALRTERDPLLRVVVADALYRSDPDQGGGLLLEAMPPSPDLFQRLRSVGRELGLPVPAVSSLLDLAVDGSSEALARLFAVAPLARGEQHDEQLEALLSDGLLEVGEASPDEMLAALRAAPQQQAQAAVELVGIGLAQARTNESRYPLARAMHAAAEEAPQMEKWLAILEHREVMSGPSAVVAAPAAAVPPEAAAAAVVRAAVVPPPAIPVAVASPSEASPAAPAAPAAGDTAPARAAPPPDANKPAAPCAAGAATPCAVPAEAARPGGG